MADDAARTLSDRLKLQLGSRVSSPEEPPAGRLQGMYIRRIMVKVEPQASLAKVREILRSTQHEIFASSALRSIRIYYDVDP